MVQLLPSGAISHFSANSGMYAPVLRSMPTRYSRAGRLSSMPLRLCSQEKLASHPRGATATTSRSSFPLAGGAAGACAQARLVVNATVSTAPHSAPRIPHRCIFPSSVLSAQCLSLLCELDVFQVREKTRNHSRKYILRNVLGIHHRFREEPEHRHFGKFAELIVAD